MKKFKGTQEKWSKSQISNGDIQIHAKGFRNLATVNFYPDGFREKYINGKLTGSPAPDCSQFRTECIYNAKVIVKAPELLEKLIQIIEAIENETIIIKENEDNDGWENFGGRFYREAKNLIKEATEH